MRVLIQRVASARVEWEGGSAGPIGRGLLCLVGFRAGDAENLLAPMAAKLMGLRIFEDDGGKMNHCLPDVEGGLLLVPQFTLYADCRKGRRPGFSTALEPARARAMFSAFEAACRGLTAPVAVGLFGAEMQVHLVNDGPVTILLDSQELGLISTSRN